MTCPECGGTAWRVTDDNGVVEPREGDRIEHCECTCGHEWTQVLPSDTTGTRVISS